ncbi:MAG: metallophosphoesterase family protein [Phycisphaerae bacterium]
MGATPDQPDAADALDKEHDDEARLRAKRVRARRVLLGAFLFILAALGLYGVWPWLLPAFIYEGPMVQMAGEHEVTLVWYMTRPVRDGMTVRSGDDAQVLPAESNGRRSHAILTGLEPGETYPYTISLGGRTLTRGMLRANKPVGEGFSFIVFGDSGEATQEQYLLAVQMTSADPDFVLHTGDLIYSHGERYNYRSRFFRPYRDLLRRVCFWPSIGNHDVFEPTDQSPYFDVFELPENGPPDLPPEHHYWFDYAAARVAVIDSNIDEAVLRDQVAPWLDDVLSESDALWKFVVLHHPAYTAGAYAPSERIQRTLVPVFENTAVDIVFTGHDHMYERTHPIRGGVTVPEGQGVVYIVSGAGGAMLYQALPLDQRPDYLAALHNQVHSFTRVSIKGDQLTLEQIALGGQTLDRWTLQKAAARAESP